MSIVEVFRVGFPVEVLARARVGGGPRERRRAALRMLKGLGPDLSARAFDGGPRGLRIGFGADAGGRDRPWIGALARAPDADPRERPA